VKLLNLNIQAYYIILEENFKWHLEAFASELFIYTHCHCTNKWIDLAGYIHQLDQGMIW